MAVSENWLFKCLGIMFFNIKQDVLFRTPGLSFASCQLLRRKGLV